MTLPDTNCAASWRGMSAPTQVRWPERLPYADGCAASADGTSKSMSGNKILTGRWTFGGERVCFKYADEPRDCYKVEVSGDVVTFYDKDGSGLRYTLLKGNPKKL